MDAVIDLWLVLGIKVAWRKGALVFLGGDEFGPTPQPAVHPAPVSAGESRPWLTASLDELTAAVRGHRFNGELHPH